jgi:hypothetical protein
VRLGVCTLAGKAGGTLARAVTPPFEAIMSEGSERS